MKPVILEGNALEVAKSRYLMEGEDWNACCKRVAHEISIPETKNRENYKQEFYDMISQMDFLPAGRILRNSGRPSGSLLNCYVVPVGDSREEIGQWLKDSLILWGEGGGCGCNISSLRPKGASVKRVGGVSSGPVSFLKASDAIAETIESGGSRRAAALACMTVEHPDIVEFIDAKLKDKILSHYNISVIINNKFIEAVEANKMWKLQFGQQKYGEIKARDLWNKIIKNMVNCAEPGLIFWDNFSKNNSYYFDPIIASNPCHTGDTLVAVADGRKHVSFKQLAKEDNDVPVFSLNDKSGKVEVKLMRRPRKTGYKQKIYKVYLDNDMYFKSNGVHKITLFDGTEKQVKDLKPNDRLHHMIKYNASLSTILNLTETKSDYVWVNNGFQKNNAEHRIIAEFMIGRKLTKDEVVHHIDFDYQNNKMENLKVMLKRDHDSYHGDKIKGDNNPMRRFPEKNYFNTHKFCGIENGNSAGYTMEQIFNIAKKFVQKLNRRPLLTEWKQYCLKHKLPTEPACIFHKYEGYKQFFDDVCQKVSVPIINQHLARYYKKYIELKEKTDLDICWIDNKIKVNRICEQCGKVFVGSWNGREVGLCSTSCAGRYAGNKYKEQQNKLVADNLNFKVDKVIEDGYEDVYNGTVDNNHNFYVFVGENKTRNDKPKLNYINSRNCGEAVMGPYNSCDLGSLVLPNFITGSINTNWKKLEATIKLAVRFLDNVLDVNKYVLKKVDISSHNSRRIGIGVIGLAEYLFAKQLRYGSEKSLFEVEKLMKFIRDVSYQASIELSIEKGAFPSFEPVAYGKSSFIRKLPVDMRMNIKKFGIRNVTTIAIAPTGTISLLCDKTSAIEPLFAKSYKRKDRVSERIYIHPMYEKMLKNNEEIPEWFVDTFDLKPEDHFNIQNVVQKYTDGAVSKTINLPKNTTDEELSELLLTSITNLKGCTVYRDTCRGEQPLNQITKEEAIEHIKKNNVKHSLETGDVSCVNGTCDL